MSETTAIEWTDSTWTPVRAQRVEQQDDGSAKRRIGWHCEHASPGCSGCYAERLNMFVGTGREFKPAHLVHVTGQGDVRGDVTVFLDERMLIRPLLWKRGRMIFVCSMTDLFAEFVSDEIIDRVFAVMALARRHTYQVLTKRAARMRAYFSNPMREALIGRQVGLIELARTGLPVTEWSGLPMPHVWLGVSAEDQRRADERIPELLGTPAAVRFLSAEPVLGPLDLTVIDIGGHREIYPLMGTTGCEDDDGEPSPDLPRINWVICGGESGPKARPMHPDWARSLRDQCEAAGVPFLFKQWGEWLPISQQAEAFTSGLYRSNRSAEPHEDQGALDDIYGRRCNVPYGVVHGDGSFHELLEPMAFLQGANPMTTFKVGKKAAGRLLGGRTHDGFPEVPR